MLDSATVEAPPADASPSPLPEATVEPKPKRGGRPKGSLNRATRDVRIAASKYTKRALTVIAKLAEQSTDPNVQLKAACELLDRAHGKPAMTQLLGGTDDPIKLEPLSDFDLARRIALVLSLGDETFAAALAAEREPRRSSREVIESFQAQQEPTSASNGVGGSEGPNVDEAAPASPEGDGEASEPQVPTLGQSAWFGDLEVQCRGPQRPNLPPSYCLRRDGRETSYGSWDMICKQVEKLGGDLSKGEIGRASRVRCR